MAELKNCPFCGSGEVIVVGKTSRVSSIRIDHRFYAKCRKCQARGPSAVGTGDFEGLRSRVVILWNAAPRT